MPGEQNRIKARSKDEITYAICGKKGSGKTALLVRYVTNTWCENLSNIKDCFDVTRENITQKIGEARPDKTNADYILITVDLTKPEVSWQKDITNYINYCNRHNKKKSAIMFVGTKLDEITNDDVKENFLAFVSNKGYAAALVSAKEMDKNELDDVIFKHCRNQICRPYRSSLPFSLYSKKGTTVKEKLELYINMKQMEEDGKTRFHKWAASLFAPKTCGTEKLRVAEKLLREINNNSDIDDVMTDDEKDTIYDKNGRLGEVFLRDISAIPGQN